jgi:UDP-glucuronate 4-epimerase
VRVAEIVDAITEEVPASKGTITFDEKPLPFPEDMDDQELVGVLGSLPYTPLQQGVRTTIEVFQRAGERGLVTRDRLR